MFDPGSVGTGTMCSDPERDAASLAAAVRAHARALGTAATMGIDVDPVGAAADLVGLVEALAVLVSAAEACSARAAAALDRVRRAEEAQAGVPAVRRGRGVPAEVGLARRESGRRGATMLGLGKILCTEMPRTMERLAAGDLSPWRAMLLVRESACLDLADRVAMDEQLCADPASLAGLGDRGLVAAAQRWCAQHDPAAVVARRARAETERRVGLRPAPDTMTRLSALLPVAQGVAVYRALTERADTARAHGDPRTRGQVMADALVARVTGHEEGSAPGLLVNLVMTDRALFHGGDTPGELPGYGPVPAAGCRQIVGDAVADVIANAGQRGSGGPGGGGAADAVEGEQRGSGGPYGGGAAGVFVRRLYVAPGSGALVAMESRARRAPPGLAYLIRVRDGGGCRVPWCDAPIRHVDHVVPAADGGPTSAANLQGLCEAHNYAKSAPGWSAEPRIRTVEAERSPVEPSAAGSSGSSGSSGSCESRHEVVTRTPSGRLYSGVAPPLPGHDHAPAPPLPGRDHAPAPPLPGRDHAPAPPLPGRDHAPVPPLPGHDPPPRARIDLASPGERAIMLALGPAA